METHSFMRGWEGALRRYSEPSRSCSLKQLVFFTYSVSGVQMAPERFRGRATTELLRLSLRSW